MVFPKITMKEITAIIIGKHNELLTKRPKYVPSMAIL